MAGASGYAVAVVGATGAVGREMLRLLESSELPIGTLVPLASARSAGSRLVFRGEEVTVGELNGSSFAGVDLALFSAGGSRSLEFAPIAARAGACVVDNSSAWRRDPGVPLVVPEVNADALAAHRGIIANPNCSTIQMVLPLEAIRQHRTIRRVIVSTYQSAAGAGQGGIDELLAGTRAHLAGEPVPARTFARPLAFDALPHIGTFESSGYTNEEEKMLFETRKIMSLPELAVSATCVRVPVLRGHLEAVTVDLGTPASAEEVRAWCASFPGIVVRDDLSKPDYPIAADCVGRNETFVGRIRRDGCLADTIHFWVVSDNLLKGAAWNAVQIAEVLHARGLVHGA